MIRGPSATARLVLALASLSLAVAAPGDAHEPEPDGLDPKRVTWSQLDLEARKLFLSATTRATFERLGHREVVIGVETKFLGKRTTDDVHLDARNARTLRRDKRQHRKDPYAKTYRFGRDRVLEKRRAPAGEGEREKEPGEWTKRSEKVHRPDQHGVCKTLADPTALLYLASGREWKVGDHPVSLCIFSDETFSRMTIRPVEEKEIEVDYAVDRDGELPTARNGKVEVTVLEIEVGPLDPKAENESNYEILGLESDVRIHLDAQNRLPVMISGKMDVIGRVEIELQRAKLR